MYKINLMYQQKQRIILGFVALLFLTIIISLYYVWHKPFVTIEAVRFVRSFWQFISALCILALGGGIGRRLARNVLPGVTQLAVHAGLGYGILGIIILAIGTFFGVNSILAWIILLLLIGVFWREVRSWLSSLSEFQIIWIESTQWGRWIAVGLAFILMMTLMVALAPPLKFDALVYHLTLPQFYKLAGEIEYTPWLIYWGMPQTGEMLYTLATALAGVEAAAALGWMVGVLAIFGVAGYLYDRIGSTAAWAGVAALTAGFTLSSSLAWAYVDWIVLLFGFCVLVLMETWGSTGDKHKLILAGVFAGFAVGTKYTAGTILLAGIILIILKFIQRRSSFKVVLLELLQFVIPSVIITLPWWIKNLLGTGNAFYPFLTSAGAMDQFRLDFYNIPVWGDWRDVLLLPIMATVTGVEGTPGYSASIGPLLLGLSLCALLGMKGWTDNERLLVHNSFVIGLVGITVWAVAGRMSGYLLQSRLFFVVFPPFAVLAGVGFNVLSQLHGAGIRFGRVAAALVLLLYGFSVLDVGRNSLKQNVPQMIFGTISSEQYFEENLGWYSVAMQAIKTLPEDSQVLMLWEPRSLYCLPKCVPDVVIDRWKHDYFTWKNQGAIIQNWRASGYTHLLFYRFGANFVRQHDHRYLSSDWDALDSLLAELPELNDFGETYILYSLIP